MLTTTFIYINGRKYTAKERFGYNFTQYGYVEILTDKPGGGMTSHRIYHDGKTLGEVHDQLLKTGIFN